MDNKVKMTRDQLIQRLAENEYEKLSSDEILQMLIDGCGGWDNATNEDLVDSAMEFMDMEVEIK